MELIFVLHYCLTVIALILFLKLLHMSEAW